MSVCTSGKMSDMGRVTSPVLVHVFYMWLPGDFEVKKDLSVHI